MSIQVSGDTAYVLITKSGSPLTDAQAEALVAEYAEHGLRFKKGRWQGENCLFVKAPAAEYIQFNERISEHGKSIQDRVGFGGLWFSHNAFVPGYTKFTPSNEWNYIVAFINMNFSSSTQMQDKKKWWQFWKSKNQYDEFQNKIIRNSLTEQKIQEFKSLCDVTSLIKFLQDEDELYLRVIIISALGEIGDTKGVNPLIETFNDKNVADLASQALIKIGSTAVESLIKKLEEIEIQESEVLKEQNSTVKVTPDYIVKQFTSVERSLVGIGNPSISHLRALIVDQNTTPLLRSRVEKILLKISKNEAYDAMLMWRIENAKMHVPSVLNELSLKLYSLEIAQGTDACLFVKKYFKHNRITDVTGLTNLVLISARDNLETFSEIVRSLKIEKNSVPYLRTVYTIHEHFENCYYDLSIIRTSEDEFFWDRNQRFY